MDKLINSVLTMLILTVVMMLVVYVGVWLTDELCREFGIKDGLFKYTGKSVILCWYFLLVTSGMYVLKSKD